MRWRRNGVLLLKIKSRDETETEIQNRKTVMAANKKNKAKKSAKGLSFFL
jgi:hypothetical protein